MVRYDGLGDELEFCDHVAKFGTTVPNSFEKEYEPLKIANPELYKVLADEIEDKEKHQKKALVYTGLSGVGTALFSLGECLDNEYMSISGAGLMTIGGLGLLDEGIDIKDKFYKAKEKISKVKNYMTKKITDYRKRNGGIDMKLDYYNNITA